MRRFRRFLTTAGILRVTGVPPRVFWGGGSGSNRGGRWRTLRNYHAQLEREHVRRILYGDPDAVEPTGILVSQPLRDNRPVFDTPRL